MKLLLLLLSLSLFAPAQTKFTRVFSTNGPKPGGPYSPGLWTGERFYVAGQGARTGAGELAAAPEAQIRQALDNVKAIIEAAGITMEHVVSMHVFYEDLAHYDTLNRVWKDYFPNGAPSRVTSQAAALPGGTPFEINAIAVRDKSQIERVGLPGSKSPVPISPALLVKDRAYVSGILGRDADAGKIPTTPEAQAAMAFDRLKRVLKAAKLDPRHLISLNVYATPAMPEDVVRKALAKHIAKQENVAITVTKTAALPFGTNIGLNGVATRHLKPRQREQNCLGADGSVYCGTFASDDYRTALTNLTGALQKFPGGKANIVATYVLLDDVKEFAAMNKIHAEVITAPLPTRTTSQPAPTGTSPKFRISVIAEQ